MRLSLWPAVMPVVVCNVNTFFFIMKQYEYKVISSVVGTEKKLNKLGFDGWELVAVFDCRLYLKREYKV